mmetsp:Transcript_62547/g.91676  ORF Transcript_62547/g.91676 Transcript_62547/m.91676 type:complete len:131 (+) Transcript_62547:989-1381(+)
MPRCQTPHTQMRGKADWRHAHGVRVNCVRVRVRCVCVRACRMQVRVSRRKTRTCERRDARMRDDKHARLAPACACLATQHTHMPGNTHTLRLLCQDAVTTDYYCANVHSRHAIVSELYFANMFVVYLYTL